MGGNLRRLVSKGDAMAPEFGAIALSPDGNRIAFTADSGRSLVTLNADGTGRGTPIRLGDRRNAVVALAWSPTTGRIAFLAADGDASARGGCTLKTVDLKTGHVSTAWSDTFLVDRSGYAGGRQFCWLRDGRIVYSRGEHTRWDLETNLWSLRLDPRTGRLSSRPRRLTSRAGEMFVYLSATGDGERVCFLSNHPQADVYTADLEAGATRLSPPRRLTLDDRMDILFGWMADSRSVLFSSDRNGTHDLFRQGPGDAKPQALVSGPGAQGGAQATPDGSTILYESAPYDGEVPNWERAQTMALDLATGETRPAGIPGSGGSIACASSPAGPCVLVEWEGDRLTFYAVDPSWVRGRELAHADSVRKNGSSWNLSPDGSRVVLGRYSFSSPIRCTVLDLSSGRSMEVRAPQGLDFGLPICWSADGKRLLVTSSVQGESVIFSTDLSGHATILFRSSDEILNVAPSPDGRRVAFGLVTRAANAWMLRGF
jgi:Tol biopolymer transport system component